MKNKTTAYNLAFVAKAICVLFFAAIFSSTLSAGQKTSSIVVRPELSVEKRKVLEEKLQAITGLTSLKFDGEGFLHFENYSPSSGSQTAREFLIGASNDKRLMVIEDASNRKDVVFCQVVKGRWVSDAANKPDVFVIEIDFADFDRLIGDKQILLAFNEGWGLLHEISHVVNDSFDAKHKDELGECEVFINQMRRECGLAERAEYFHTFHPAAVRSDFSTRLVRIGFDWHRPNTNKKKRYWLTWDASLVGGLDASQNIAAR